MFAALARLMYRRRWWVLAISAVVASGVAAALARGGALTTGAIEGTEADHTQRLVEGLAGLSGDSVVAVVFSAPGWSAGDERFVDALRSTVERMRQDPDVQAVTSPLDGPPLLAMRFISEDGRRALVLVRLKGDLRAAARSFPKLREEIRAGPLQAAITGKPAFLWNLDKLLERDLVRAELVSFPLALLVLLMVFRTWVAAALPIGVGVFAVTSGVAGVLMLSRVTIMAQYTINVVTLIGLGVAIDYSLFIVSRFRDELNAGATVEDALVRSLDTSGRAVAFSGLAVAVGLSGLLFYRGSYLSAMGIAGAIVVACAVAYALTLLPALLSVLGRGIERGRVPLPRLADRPGVWHSFSTWVMRHPLLVLAPTLAILLLLGSPFRRLRMAATDITALPPDAEARRSADELARYFPREAANRIVVAVEFPSGDVFTPRRVAALYDYSRRIAVVPGASAVESIVDLDPSLDRAAYVQLAGIPRDFLPPDFDIAARTFIAGRVTVLYVLTRAPSTSPDAEELVRRLRADRSVAEGRVWVGGQTANNLDAMAFIQAHTPAALGFVMAMTALVLFLLLGSVVLPLKALVMNLLSIAGSFGALVWIFQEGHLRNLLRFEPGPIEPSLPILLFCAVFGLSMDYEVLLLSRIQEEYRRTGDNTQSVAEGLERTGGLITSAAAIMVAVFAAFALATVVVVKAMGLGMAIAVTIDATLVRVLLVPATMRLFGNANWWAPRPLARWFAAAQRRRPQAH
ncbi:MAG TPA: MMPL family transporter [Myxococcaceae bacterium]|nr:MMPL family transporter [Myxococcaceae bacterium]